MRIIRYEDKKGLIHYGALQDDGSVRRIDGDIFGKHTVLSESAEIVRTLKPFDPWAIIGIGLNYKAHAEETGKSLPANPLVFIKLPSAAADPGATILLPRKLRSDKVDYEGELAVVIGKRCHNVPEAEALNYVLGYTCANDVSARDWQFEWGAGQFNRGKTFATFCPLGPVLATPESIPDPSALTLKTRLNGEEVQTTPTSDLIFNIPQLIAFLSGSTILEPGTVILTGTPSGVGYGKTPPRFLQAGDTVDVEISGIGTLTNPVAEEA